MQTELAASAALSPYDHAAAEIAAGRATGKALWVLLASPTDRDGYALRPAVWEGSGEYQHVKFHGAADIGTLVKIPGDRRSLPTDWPRRPADPHAASTRSLGR